MKRIGVAFPGDPSQPRDVVGHALRRHARPARGRRRARGDPGRAVAARARRRASTPSPSRYLRPGRDLKAAALRGRAAAWASPALAAVNSWAAPEARCGRPAGSTASSRSGPATRWRTDVPIATFEDMTSPRRRRARLRRLGATLARRLRVAAGAPAPRLRAGRRLLPDQPLGRRVGDRATTGSRRRRSTSSASAATTRARPASATGARRASSSWAWTGRARTATACCGRSRGCARSCRPRGSTSSAAIRRSTQPGVTGHGVLRLNVPEQHARLERLFGEATCFVMPSHLRGSRDRLRRGRRRRAAEHRHDLGRLGLPDRRRRLVVDPHDDEALLAAMRRLADPATAERMGAPPRQAARARGVHLASAGGSRTRRRAGRRGSRGRRADAGRLGERPCEAAHRPARRRDRARRAELLAEPRTRSDDPATARSAPCGRGARPGGGRRAARASPRRAPRPAASSGRPRAPRCLRA